MGNVKSNHVGALIIRIGLWVPLYDNYDNDAYGITLALI